MKNIVSLLLVTGCFLYQNVWSQCNPFYDIDINTRWEITQYDHKDKQIGRQINEVVSYDETSNGWKAVMNFEIYDKKDELVMEKEEVELECENGVIHMDMERFIPSEMMESLKGMNMDIDIDNVQLPSDLSVGQSLDDGSIVISGDLPMTMRVDITDRKVAAKEKVTTPAGTFECYKITYTIKTKMMMGRESKAAEWIAKDVGLVKSESYKNNGKLMSYSLLTKVE